MNLPIGHVRNEVDASRLYKLTAAYDVPDYLRSHHRRTRPCILQKNVRVTPVTINTYQESASNIEF